MRSLEDIVSVHAAIERKLELDLERMELDPTWIQVRDSYGVDSKWHPDFSAAVSDYLKHYIIRDQFPHQVPSTNGPGDIGTVQLEITWPNRQQ